MNEDFALPSDESLVEEAPRSRRKTRPDRPTGLALDEALAGASDAFLETLTRELVARGFTEPAAFLVPGAANKLASAVMAAAKTDAQALQALARNTMED